MKIYNRKISLNKIKNIYFKTKLKKECKKIIKLIKAFKYKNANPEYYEPRIHAGLLRLEYSLLSVKGKR